MQEMAAKFLSPATAFVSPCQNQFSIRWFSPTAEILLCGHGTLAAAAVIDYLGLEYSPEFLTHSGVLLAASAAEQSSWFEIALPANPPQLIEKLPVETSHNFSSVKSVYQNAQAVFLLLEHEDDVAQFVPNLKLLKVFVPQALVLTAPSNHSCDVDFVSRYFWPDCEGLEDAVTGSAHTGLVPIWREILGKDEFKARQISNRGGELRCRMAESQVFVAGRVKIQPLVI